MNNSNVKLIESSLYRKEKRTVVEEGTYEILQGTIDNLLIESSTEELEDVYVGLINKVRQTLPDGGSYKIICLMYLYSEQGYKVRVKGIMIYTTDSFSKFISCYKENVQDLEEKYIKGEEYEEQKLNILRQINTKFYYHIWSKQ
eukprot:TRINITY_DN8577_c0_g1_i1.p1 TRINITY_DN8577_c0_g1~~TRINITY_DN8577_c0_g1_i1.p1  ORF type:complete len:144 (+),score=23.20 TRINITY_DN8577_c0_g1_i1:34-465(+)